jgi:Uma2 family endonuclease
MSAANQLPYLMTADEFLTWEAPDGSERWELIDGTPQAMAPSRPRHGRIAAETGRLIGNHLADHPRCSVVTEAGVRPDGYNLRIPDLSVSCEPTGPDDLVLREPVLIVEILSPSNARDTWAAVVRYMTIPSVQEVLVLHSTEIKAERLRRAPDGPWPRVTLLSGSTVVLESIGFAEPLSSFYRTAGAA